MGKAKGREYVRQLVEKLGKSNAFESVNTPDLKESNDKNGYGVDFTLKARLKP
jgi:hypothetical protein